MSEFHETFKIQHEKELKKFFDENGYVAIRGILTDDDCQNTLDDIDQQMKKIDPRFDINDASTYEHAPILNNFGMYAKKPIITEQFCKNRQNDSIHRAFQILCGEDQILVSIDRCAFYRPTIDHPDWKTNYVYPGLHLDFHPSSYLNCKTILDKRESLDYSTTADFVAENNLYSKLDGIEIQCVINLMDNYEDDGGFQCVPGFHKEYPNWVTEKDFKNDYGEGVYHFSKTDKIDMKYVHSPKRVPVPRGTVIFWTQFMAHGTKPNNSNNPRCIQFMKGFGKKIVSKERLKKRSACLKKEFAQISFIPDKIGRKVFNL
ncbi:MAG: hypothetical protein Hyperionvirus16_33 [Hyperionvirus sp.]|uniref:Phytanoyl-CoA dioxygenase family protein n=1 Tax=Hyperionvirus sp. TaxID=2487770 RepID=A0A3G5A9Y0_9VIRU|nr:MAG: hypothetical protein Hyperionvirus16_33 [Hyperionvirus sp.]